MSAEKGPFIKTVYNAVLPNRVTLTHRDARLLAHLLNPQVNEPGTTSHVLHEALYPGKPYSHNRLRTPLRSVQRHLASLDGAIRPLRPNPPDSSRAPWRYILEIPPDVRAKIRIVRKDWYRQRRTDIAFQSPNGEIARGKVAQIIHLLLHHDHLNLQSAISSVEAYWELFGKGKKYSRSDMNTLIWQTRKFLGDTGIKIISVHHGKGNGGGSLPAVLYLDCSEYREKLWKETQERKKPLTLLRRTYETIMAMTHEQWYPLTRWNAASLIDFVSTLQYGLVDPTRNRLTTWGLDFDIDRNSLSPLLDFDSRSKPLIDALMFILRYRDYYEQRTPHAGIYTESSIDSSLLLDAVCDVLDLLGSNQLWYERFHPGEQMRITRLIHELFPQVAEHLNTLGVFTNVRLREKRRYSGLRE